VVLQSRYDAKEVSSAIYNGTLTNIMGVPIMFRKVLEERPEDASRSRLRFCLCSGDGLSKAMDEAFYQRFNCPIFEFFGLSEMPHVVSHSLKRDRRSKEFSCGRAVCGVRVEVRGENRRALPVGEVGELACLSPFAFKEYFRDPESTNAAVIDGWFYTGDLVRQDEDGYIFFVERKKELIKSSGFNILPGEVEQTIAAVDGVKEVAVIGVPNPDKGQHVAAYIVRTGTSTESDVKARILVECKTKLAKYKIPQDIKFLPELPRGPTGKLRKKDLHELAARQHGHKGAA